MDTTEKYANNRAESYPKHFVGQALASTDEGEGLRHAVVKNQFGEFWSLGKLIWRYRVNDIYREKTESTILLADNIGIALREKLADHIS